MDLPNSHWSFIKALFSHVWLNVTGDKTLYRQVTGRVPVAYSLLPPRQHDISLSQSQRLPNRTGISIMSSRVSGSLRESGSSLFRPTLGWLEQMKPMSGGLVGPGRPVITLCGIGRPTSKCIHYTVPSFIQAYSMAYKPTAIHIYITARSSRHCDRQTILSLSSLT